MSCEFYERLTAGPLGWLLKERGDRFFKVVKLLAGALPLVSPLAEVAELVADLSRPSLAGELVELIKAAKSAGQCEEVAKRAAEKLGVSEEWLRTLAKNLAALPEVDLSQLEERLRRLNEGLELLRRLSPHVLDLTRLFVEGGGCLLVNTPFGVVEYVEVGVEGRVREILSSGRVAVVYGPRGVGKSTAALKAIYDFARAQPGRVAVVMQVGENWKEALRAATQLRDGPFVPVLYYDTLEAGGYKRGGKGMEVIYSAMAYAKPLADFLHDAALLRVPTVVVLTEEDYRAHEGVVKRVGAEAVRLGGEAEALVRGILRGVPNAVAETVLERYKGEFYVVAAALAKALYEEWRDPAKVAEAVKRLNVYSLPLAYLWHVVLGADEAVARRAAPLILATGLLGPHPPKLAKAVVEAFGKEPDSAVVKWLSQPLHGTLYEAIRKVAHDAVYRRFGVGSDEVCQDSAEGPCRLVEICAEVLAGVPRKRYNDVEEVAVEYATFVARALEAPGPAGVRQIDFLIDDFLRAYNGVAEDGRWRIRYEVKMLHGIEMVESVVDELDVLSALYGLAVLPDWSRLLKPLEDWFFVGDEKANAVRPCLFFLLKERSEELAKRAVVIAKEVEERGFYTNVDLWRAVGIAATGDWGNATDEELESVVRLLDYVFGRFASVSAQLLHGVEPPLGETWRRVESERASSRLADWLATATHNVARSSPVGLLFFFTIAKDGQAPLAQRFAALYNAGSNVAKLWLLNTLLYALISPTGLIVAAGSLNTQVEPWEAFKELAKRVKEFVSRLDDVERAYAVALLYPRLAYWYSLFDEVSKAEKFADEAVDALDELKRSYAGDKVSTEEKLWEYLRVMQVRPDLRRELSGLSAHAHYHVAFAYMIADKLGRAIEHAKISCEAAVESGEAYYEVASCSLLSRLKAVREGAPPVDEFERAWLRALQNVNSLGVETIAKALGHYIVALASVGRLSDVEKVLEEWGWALERDLDASALTYGVLSLLDGRYLGKAVVYLPEWARANLPMFVEVLYEAVEAGLFAEGDAEAATRVIENKYGQEAEKALTWATLDSGKLFLSALVGLAYCERGEEYGLNLAEVTSRLGSSISGLHGRLFRELAKALEGTTIGNCVTDEVLRAMYKLYYSQV